MKANLEITALKKVYLLLSNKFCVQTQTNPNKPKQTQTNFVFNVVKWMFGYY